MNRLEAALLRLRAELDSLGADWAVIGGLALSVRAEPRTTRDIDIAIAVDDDRQAEQLVLSLAERGYRHRHEGILEQTAANRLATVRLESPGERGMAAVVVDLMFASSGIEREVTGNAERIEVLPGVVLPVATRGHLIALKVLAGREQDIADVASLLREASPGDLDEARSAADLISRRGYDRGKDLLTALAERIERRSRS